MAEAKQFPINGVKSVLLGGKHIHTPINPAKLAAEVKAALGINLNTDPFSPGVQHGSPEIWRKAPGYPALKGVHILTSYDEAKLQVVRPQFFPEDPDAAALIREAHQIAVRDVARQMIAEGGISAAKNTLRILTSPQVVQEREDHYDADGWNTPTFRDRVEMHVGYESDVCPRCEDEVPREQEHWCSEIVLYEEERLPNASTEIVVDEKTGTRGTRLVPLDPTIPEEDRVVGILHAITFKPHGLDKARLTTLSEIVKAHRP